MLETGEGSALVLFPHWEPARVIAANLAWHLWKPGKYPLMIEGDRRGHMAGDFLIR